VLRLLLRSPWVKRATRGIPVARLLLAAEVALIAGRHLGRLDRTERRRLLTLLVKARGRARSLGTAERRELAALAVRLEPRLFLATAVRHLSPIPLPKRLLYGPRGGAARAALSRGGRRG
jgi:hypothetical protein